MAKPVFLLSLLTALLAFPFFRARAVASPPHSTPNSLRPQYLTPAATLLLYDAASGTIPAAPLMNFVDIPPGAASPFYESGATVLDTTTLGSGTYAGWVSEGTVTPGFPILDRGNGYGVNFTVQVESETHGNNNRAGFSVIILSDDKKGVELAFWEDEIWVQNDSSTGGLFTHGEGVAFDTTTSLVDYRMLIAGDTYTLTVDANVILTGVVRDYTDFSGLIDPYESSNFLFFGDDTTSAQARIRLTHVSVTSVVPQSIFLPLVITENAGVRRPADVVFEPTSPVFP